MKEISFTNFSVLILKVFNVIWLAILVLQTQLLYSLRQSGRYCGEFPFTILWKKVTYKPIFGY